MNSLNKWLDFGKGVDNGFSIMGPENYSLDTGNYNMPDWSNFGNTNQFTNVNLDSLTNDASGMMDRITGSVSGTPGMFDKFSSFAAKNQPLLNFGIGALTGIAQGIQGYNMNKMYNKGMKNQMEQWNKQYNMNRQLTNNQLAERAQRAYAARGNTGVNPEEYMKKWGV